jgi:capsular polysaccharide biosynthesis protein
MDAKQEPATTAAQEADGATRSTTDRPPTTADEHGAPDATSEADATSEPAAELGNKHEFRFPWRIAIVAGAVLVALGIPILAAAIGISVANGAERLYVSQAVAIATKTKIPPDDFAQVAPSVFATDTVLDPVISELSLSQTPAQLLSSGTLSAEAVEQTVAVRIVAQASDPTRAQELANAATDSLSRALSVYRVAELKAFPASVPSSPQPPPRTSYAILGAAGGLAIVLASAWALWMIGRRKGWSLEGPPPASEEPDSIIPDTR